MLCYQLTKTVRSTLRRLTNQRDGDGLTTCRIHATAPITHWRSSGKVATTVTHVITTNGGSRQSCGRLETFLAPEATTVLMMSTARTGSSRVSLLSYQPVCLVRYKQHSQQKYSFHFSPSEPLGKLMLTFCVSRISDYSSTWQPPLASLGKIFSSDCGAWNGWHEFLSDRSSLWLTIRQDSPVRSHERQTSYKNK